MGELFTLDAATKAVIQMGLDDLITELGKPSRIFYPPRWVSCENCVEDPIGQKSSNFWLHGGPIPFPNGTICPLCDGQGRRAEEQTEDILLSLNFDVKTFRYPIANLDVRQPHGLLEVKCYLTDLPKLQRCSYLIPQVAIEGYLRKKFKLVGEPADVSNIIQNRYVISLWEQM